MILHTLEAGHGPPVALLHGLFGRAQNLAAVARHLAPTHRVLSLDLRNHGASPHAPGMAYAELAADVFATLAAVDALPCALLGHSMGGKVAMVAALTAPANVTRLLVADIAPVAYAHHNRRIAEAMLAMKLTPGMTRAAADTALSEAVPDAAVRSYLLQNFVPGATPFWRIGLAEIAAGLRDIESFPAIAATFAGPALFVRGENSDYIQPAHRAAINARFSAARIETIPHAAHWLHADQPEAFNTMSGAFLTGPDHSSRPTGM